MASPINQTRDLPSEPTTPDTHIRNRWHPASPSSPSPDSSSPTSTTVSSSASGPFAASAFRNVLQTTSAGGNYATGPTFNLATPTRKVVIRADPSLVTCFDPKDKELYELWAPKT